MTIWTPHTAVTVKVVGLAWRGDSPNQPANPEGLDPAASLIGGNDFGTIAWEGGLELSYAFGSSLLRAQDQRWR